MAWINVDGAIFGCFNQAKGICRAVHIPIDSYGVMQMDSEDLVNAVLDRAYESDGKLRLDCAQAFVLAKELRVEVAKIAQVCNRHNIRISKCQLGCFS